MEAVKICVSWAPRYKGGVGDTVTESEAFVTVAEALIFESDCNVAVTVTVA